MSFRKYVGDYRLENVPDKSGRLKTKAVYKGDGYELSASPEDTAAAKPLMIVCVLLFWAAQLVALLLNTRCARCMWVLMPQAFALLAFGFASVGAWMFLRAQAPMTREYAERMRDRFSGGSFMAMILNGAALIGAVIAAFLYKDELFIPQDIVYIAMLTLAQGACVYSFINRKAADVRAIPSDCE
ncbi:MAG: hypothetical protein E7554_00265 [Ruminococcaceae bacterium]|nr:hypothetical protein [Oscillospiraceae bacterium]